ncbi:MAG: hypothetical protein V1901_04190 [Patescibacteria group bacterium]
MKIEYCDKCGKPFKHNEIKWLLCEDKYLTPDPLDSYKPLNQRSYIKEMPMEQNDRVVCIECKAIYDLFFQLRFEKLLEVAEEIKRAYLEPVFDIKKIMLNKLGEIK